MQLVKSNDSDTKNIHEVAPFSSQNKDKKKQMKRNVLKSKKNGRKKL